MIRERHIDVLDEQGAAFPTHCKPVGEVHDFMQTD
jgi:hypothetical protein